MDLLPSLFISHSTQDLAWCRDFVAALRQAGADCFFDNDSIPGSAEWIKLIEREVGRRNVFVLVLTPHSWGARWVHEELQLALVKDNPIKPILVVQHILTPGVEGVVTTRQWINAIGLDAAVVAQMVIEALHKRQTTLSPQPGAGGVAPGVAPGAAPGVAPVDDATIQRQVAALLQGPIEQSRRWRMQRSAERLTYVLANWRKMRFDEIPQFLNVEAMEQEAAATLAGPVRALTSVRSVLSLLLVLVCVASISLGIWGYGQYLSAHAHQTNPGFVTLWNEGFDGRDPLTLPLTLALAVALLVLMALLSVVAFSVRAGRQHSIQQYRKEMQRVLLEIGKLKAP